MSKLSFSALLLRLQMEEQEAIESGRRDAAAHRANPDAGEFRLSAATNDLWRVANATRLEAEARKAAGEYL